MSLNPTWLFVSLVPAGIGFVLFVYGKKQGRWPQLTVGLLFMIYPYFTPGLVSLVSTGGVLALVLWYALRLGW
jgi:4-hydroxybenzoate polyprenyltransferase